MKKRDSYLERLSYEDLYKKARRKLNAALDMVMDAAGTLEDLSSKANEEAEKFDIKMEEADTRSAAIRLERQYNALSDIADLAEDAAELVEDIEHTSDDSMDTLDQLIKLIRLRNSKKTRSPKRRKA